MPNGTFPIAQAEVLTSGAALSALVIVRTFLSLACARARAEQAIGSMIP